MKKISTIAILSLLIISCKKEKDDGNSNEETKINFNGRWAMISDTTRFIDVLKISDSVVDITFPKKIDTPPSKQGSITISYKITVSNDTAYCISGTIYPTCYFINKKTFYRGYIAEWIQGPDIGKIEEMIK